MFITEKRHFAYKQARATQVEQTIGKTGGERALQRPRRSGAQTTAATLKRQLKYEARRLAASSTVVATAGAAICARARIEAAAAGRRTLLDAVGRPRRARARALTVNVGGGGGCSGGDGGGGCSDGGSPRQRRRANRRLATIRARARAAQRRRRPPTSRSRAHLSEAPHVLRKSELFKCVGRARARAQVAESHKRKRAQAICDTFASEQ